jgi:hypothetical protein
MSIDQSIDKQKRINAAMKADPEYLRTLLFVIGPNTVCTILTGIFIFLWKVKGMSWIPAAVFFVVGQAWLLYHLPKYLRKLKAIREKVDRDEAAEKEKTAQRAAFF